MKLINEQLKRIYPSSSETNRQKYLPYLNEYMEKYQINTFERICAFLAQIGHECKQLESCKENLNYSVSGLRTTFTNYFTPKTNVAPNPYARRPEKIANYVYANRNGNGNTNSGDGWKYKGRGLIQTTGKGNYAQLSKDTGIDFMKNPELLETPEYAVLSACWFWSVNKLNTYCTLKEADFKTLTRRINGGYNGYADRVNLWDRAKDVLSKL